MQSEEQSMEAMALEPYIRAFLHGDEEVRAHARSTSAVLAVTTRRVVVADPDRVALAVPFDAVRRVQFDVERRRPATLVIVPEDWPTIRSLSGTLVSRLRA
jgi:hypothetical protein